MEPISAGIMAGASLINGLMNMYGTHKAGQLSESAQEEANRLNQMIFEKQFKEDTRRWEIQNALEKMQLRLYKDRDDYTREETLDQKNYNRAQNFIAGISGMADKAQIRGMNLANMWGQQSAPPKWR